MDHYLMFHAIGREPDYLELNKQFITDFTNDFYIVNMVPPMLKPYGLYDYSI